MLGFVCGRRRTLWAGQLRYLSGVFEHVCSIHPPVSVRTARFTWEVAMAGSTPWWTAAPAVYSPAVYGRCSTASLSIPDGFCLRLAPDLPADRKSTSPARIYLELAMASTRRFEPTKNVMISCVLAATWRSRCSPREPSSSVRSFDTIIGAAATCRGPGVSAR